MLPLLVVLALGSFAAAPSVSQPARDQICSEWRDCRERALEAASRGEYEAFHDLAWRAIQTGPPKDPALMYLLARAQSLSGRPHDALVMLDRLAEMGVASDAATNDDFNRMRQLPGWPELKTRIERVSQPAPAPQPDPADTSSSRPPAPDSGASPSIVGSPAIAELVRFSAERFAVGGLAYDAVSHRFLFGDRLGRKVIVVSEGSTHAIDLVRADSAGFQDISAIEIDARRGDLWVASNAADGGSGVLHRLQLVAGRPLKAFPVAAALEPVELVDLAVSPTGAVLVLDALSRQLLVLREGATSLERIARIDVHEPTSLASAGNEGLAYVAHRDGVSRVDLRTRTITLVAAPNGISLARLERIRWRRHALIAVKIDADGSRRIVHLALNVNGSAVTHATRLEAAVPTAGPTYLTMYDDELVCFAVPSSNGAGDASPDTSSGLAEFVAYRIRLR